MVNFTEKLLLKNIVGINESLITSYLMNLRDEGYILPNTYRRLYRQSKGNLFRSIRYLDNYIKENNLAEKRLPSLLKIIR